MPIADIQGAKIKYNVYGNGTTIIFVHPPVVSAEIFSYQVNELSKYYRVITFDIRGHGQSDSSIEPLTYSLIAKDIKDLMDYLNISKTFLCGYSMGSTVVIEFLLNYPERAFGAILVGGISKSSGTILRSMMYLGYLTSTLRLRNTLTLSVSFSNSNNFYNFKRLFKKSRYNDMNNVSQYFKSGITYDSSAELSKIYHPIMLVYGEKDGYFHSHALILGKKLRNSQIRFIQNKRHQLPTKAHRQLNSIIKDFIDNYK